MIESYVVLLHQHSYRITSTVAESKSTYTIIATQIYHNKLTMDLSANKTSQIRMTSGRLNSCESNSVIHLKQEYVKWLTGASDEVRTIQTWISNIEDKVSVSEDDDKVRNHIFSVFPARRSSKTLDENSLLSSSLLIKIRKMIEPMPEVDRSSDLMNWSLTSAMRLVKQKKASASACSATT